MKEQLRKIVGEMITVILGILIALFVNDWKMNKDNERFLDQVITSISLEMEENVAELQDVIPLHQQLMDTIEHYLHDSDMTISEILYNVGGVKGVNIKNTSWQSFLNPYIQLVDYEIISILTDIEESKQHMSQQTASLMTLVYPNVESTEASQKKALRILIGDLFNTEQQLLELHEGFLARIKGHH